MSKSLAEMGREVFSWAESKGWEPDERSTFGDCCALLHSEVSEALEAYRVKGVFAYVGNENPEVVFSQEYRGLKPEGVPSEFADVLIRLLHYSARYGIDLEAEYEAKMSYNQKRPYRHGNKAL